MEHPAPHKTTPKDFFLYAFAAGALYFSATTLITLLWQLINRWFPDLSTLDYYSLDSMSSLLRWSIALLIIIFPAYVAAMWWIGKDMDKDPAKRELWVRRWFIWATLFIAAVTMLGDLVFLVYTLLGGDVALRFILKAIAVGAVAKAVFWYHWYLLRRKPGASMRTRRTIVIVASAFVLAAIIAGFSIAGSPAQARAMRNDARRISDLQQIQWQVTDYWQRKQALPASLDDLVDPANPVPLPMDPVSGAAYRYQARDTYEFVLCTDFETAANAQETARMMGYPADSGVSFAGKPATWDHAAGDTCFVRTIDPQRYPPLNQAPQPVEAQ